jgi:hypothetical protein
MAVLAKREFAVKFEQFPFYMGLFCRGNFSWEAAQTRYKIAPLVNASRAFASGAISHPLRTPRLL